MEWNKLKEKALDDYRWFLDMGDIDEEIIPVLDYINSLDNFCTLYSCAGHVSGENAGSVPYISLYYNTVPTSIYGSDYEINITYAPNIKGKIEVHTDNPFRDPSYIEVVLRLTNPYDSVDIMLNLFERAKLILEKLYGEV